MIDSQTHLFLITLFMIDSQTHLFIITFFYDWQSKPVSIYYVDPYSIQYVECGSAFTLAGVRKYKYIHCEALRRFANKRYI